MLTARGAMEASSVLKQRLMSLLTNTTVEEHLRITDEKQRSYPWNIQLRKERHSPIRLRHNDKIGEIENLLNKQLK